MNRLKSIVTSKFLLFFSLTLLMGASTAFAGIWGDSVDSIYYSGTRTSGTGITDTYNGTFQVAWSISYNETSTFWDYSYTLSNGSQFNDMILELFDDSILINNFMFTDKNGTIAGTYDAPMDYTSLLNGTTLNDLHGIKMLGSGNPVTYSFETDAAPVWGNFFTEKGTKYAYNNALAINGFNSSSITDFIAAPGSSSTIGASVAPEPISSVLFIIGGATLAGRRFIRRKK